jgi:hypothetical protein
MHWSDYRLILRTPSAGRSERLREPSSNAADQFPNRAPIPPLLRRHALFDRVARFQGLSQHRQSLRSDLNSRKRGPLIGRLLLAARISCSSSIHVRTAPKSFISTGSPRTACDRLASISSGIKPASTTFANTRATNAMCCCRAVCSVMPTPVVFSKSAAGKVNIETPARKSPAP